MKLDRLDACDECYRGNYDCVVNISPSSSKRKCFGCEGLTCSFSNPDIHLRGRSVFQTQIDVSRALAEDPGATERERELAADIAPLIAELWGGGSSSFRPGRDGDEGVQ